MSDLKMSDISGLRGRYEFPWRSINYQNQIVDIKGNEVLFTDLHEHEKEELCRAVYSYDGDQAVISDQQELITKLQTDVAKLRYVLKGFIPMGEDGNGPFVYNEGSEDQGDDVNRVLEETKQPAATAKG